MWEAFAVQKRAKAFHVFSTKNISVFGYKVVKHLTSWPLNELVKLTMLWTTGPRSLIQIQSYVLTGLSTMGSPSDMIIIRTILYLHLCSDTLITNQCAVLLYRIWVSCEVFHIQDQGWSWSELQLDPYWYRQTNHLTDPTKWPQTVKLFLWFLTILPISSHSLQSRPSSSLSVCMY